MEFCAVARTEFSNAAFHKARVALGELGVVSRVSSLQRSNCQDKDFTDFGYVM